MSKPTPSRYFLELFGAGKTKCPLMRPKRTMRALSLCAAALFSASFSSLAYANSTSEIHHPPGAAKGASVVIDRAHHAAIVADADNHALHVVDLISGDITTTPLSCAPEQVMLLGDFRVAVSLRGCGQVGLFSLNGLGEAEPIASAKVAAEPYGLAYSPANQAILVSSAYGHALTALDAETLSARFTMDMPREPRGITVSPDGKRVFVTHAVGAQLSVVDLMPVGGEGPVLRRLHALTGNYRNGVDGAIGASTLHPSASLAHTAVLNEEGTRLFVPHLLVQNGAETTRIIAAGYGGVAISDDTSFASVSVISVKTEETLGASFRDVPPHAVKPKSIPQVAPAPLLEIRVGPVLAAGATAPAGSPSRQTKAAAVMGDFLYAASFGTGELLELDARSLDPAMSVRRTFSVGEGPTGVDVDPHTRIAVVWSQHEHTLSVVNVDSGEVERYHIAENPLSEEMARGRTLFVSERDARISRDGRACSSCHPDGRDDGLVWRLGDGPRRTLMLAGRLGHGPYGWNGIHQTLEGNIRETIGRLGGTGLSELDLRALAAYVKDGLTPPPSAIAGDEKLDPMAQRGHDIFVSEKAACSSCHVLDREASDRKRYDVASMAKGESQTMFRTPPLRSLSGAGSYFHDGRYSTLEQLIDDNLDRMGQTSHLNAHDKAALVAFLKVL